MKFKNSHQLLLSCNIYYRKKSLISHAFIRIANILSIVVARQNDGLQTLFRNDLCTV